MLSAPPLVGTPEGRAEQAQRIDYVPIRTLARIAPTRHRLVELIQTLRASLVNHDRRMGGMDPTSGSGLP